MNIFEVVLIQPILNLLLFFNFIFSSIHLPFSFGFSIVGLTVFVRLVLAPLTASQLKSAVKTAELRPKLAELSKKHGSDKQALARAQMDLYRAHGVNPAAGCLPLILQMPIFIALYQVLLKVLANGGNFAQVNQLAYLPFLAAGNLQDLGFFGFNLAAKPSGFAQTGFQLLLIPPVTAVLQFWQSKLMMPPRQDGSGQAVQQTTSGDKKPSMEESLGQMQSQMIWLMPAMIGFFSFGFPVGLSLYWNIFSIFGIIQQYWIKNDFKPSSILKFGKL